MPLPAFTLGKKDENENGSILEEAKPEHSIYQYPEANESFLEGKPSKVEEVIECLEGIENANKTDSSKKRAKSVLTIDDINFLVTKRNPSQSSIFRRPRIRKVPINTNQFTFMRQIEFEPGDRLLAREQREDVAETFRRFGNFEYRKLNFLLAKDYYTKGLQYIKDSPVLYVNRAMCFIKMREFKLGILDCDYVLTKLDECYLRAWLYRGAAYKRLNDEANYEYSIEQARQSNRPEAAFIDEFLEKMRSLL
ncbi:tetratricopeptide repeat protein 12 [Drosophila eugracilis]|uniref:tetratricopeptide repeat protein 12 n=1 Tax=Drosophila eugracilis TaxID=29029 RepID=UPI001BDB3667|nr:tetratricopeptide repeat protein 12 [Drosophila eugracilis]